MDAIAATKNEITPEGPAIFLATAPGKTKIPTPKVAAICKKKLL